MGNGATTPQSLPDLDTFKRLSTEYDKFRASGLTQDEIHGIFQSRLKKKQSMLTDSDYDGSIRQVEVVSKVSVGDSTASRSIGSTLTSSSAFATSVPSVGLALLIDDSAMALKTQSKIIQTAGFDVITASSAKMGFDVLLNRKDDIDVVFLDVVMPNVDGVECLSWIKDRADLSSIPVFMLSGLEDETLSKVCLERGAEGILLKPLSFETVKPIAQVHAIGMLRRAATVVTSSPVSPTKKKAQSVSTAASTAQFRVGSVVPAFKVVTSDLDEFAFPSSSFRKMTLLIFIPSIFCTSLYSNDGFMVRLLSNYELLSSTQRFVIVCISADLPFAMSAAKKRFQLPFTLASDPSLFLANKFVGTIDIGSVLAQQEYNAQQAAKLAASTAKQRKKGTPASVVQAFASAGCSANDAKHELQRRTTHRLGMVLLDRRRTVLEKWVADVPLNSTQEIDIDNVSMAQFPSNFKDWMQTESAADEDDPIDNAGSLPKAQRGASVSTGQGNTEVKEASCSQSDSPKQLTPDESLSAVQKVNVLVIEDSSVSSRVICKKLEAMGFSTRAAYDGLQGFEALRKKDVSFSLVLCDIVMPNCDGVGFLKLVKEQKDLQEVPVVMLCGLEGEELTRTCSELGASQVVKKPFDESAFFTVLEELRIPVPNEHSSE